MSDQHWHTYTVTMTATTPEEKAKASALFDQFQALARANKLTVHAHGNAVGGHRNTSISEKFMKSVECACIGDGDCYCRAPVPRTGDMCGECTAGKHLRWSEVKAAILKGRVAREALFKRGEW